MDYRTDRHGMNSYLLLQAFVAHHLQRPTTFCRLLRHLWPSKYFHPESLGVTGATAEAG